MGTQKSLLLHLLESPWQQSSPFRAFERTHPLALEMGRPFVTQGPLPCLSASAPQRLSSVLPAAGPAWVCLQLAPRLPACQPAIITNHLTFQLVAQRLVWRQKEEGDSGGRKESSFRLSLLSPLVLVSSSSLPPFAPVPVLLAI